MPPLWGSINVWKQLTQGLRPGLCGSVALAGLIDVFTTNQLLAYFDALPLPEWEKIYRLLIVDRVYYILSNERVMNNLIALRN